MKNQGKGTHGTVWREGRMPGLWSWPCYSFSVWLWVSYGPSLGFSFLLWKKWAHGLRIARIPCRCKILQFYDPSYGHSCMGLKFALPFQRLTTEDKLWSPHQSHFSKDSAFKWEEKKEMGSYSFTVSNAQKLRVYSLLHLSTSFLISWIIYHFILWCPYGGIRMSNLSSHWCHSPIGFFL